ncbi:hypothetical protein VCHA43P273_350002 [Vibrio chagasii]|nr:hypothetical protein VCHA43P273_350002 [Vibrio chagasii]
MLPLGEYVVRSWFKFQTSQYALTLLESAPYKKNRMKTALR